MSRSFPYAATLLTTGLVLGLGAGAWLWRGGAEHGAQARLTATARPPDPAALRRQADRALDEASGGVTARPGGDRVAELAATFRALEGSTEEGLSAQIEAIVGLAGLTSDELARLMEFLAEGKSDVEAAETAAWLAREPAAQEAADDLTVHVAQRWWRANGSAQEVAAWAVSLPVGKAQDAALGEVGRLWVEQDAVSASEWLGTLGASAGRDEAVRRMVWKVSQEAPDEAFEWACTIQQAFMRSEMLEASVQAWAARDLTAAQVAVATLPPEHRGNLVAIIEQAQAAKK